MKSRLAAFLLVVIVAGASASEQLDVLSQSYSFSSDAPLPGTAMRGQLRPINFTILSAGIDGKIKRFDARSGTRLREGQPIVEFACDQEDAEYKIASARVKVAEKNLEVNRRLEEYKNISEFEIVTSEAELAIARADEQRTAAVVRECKIMTPYDVVVTEKLVQAHQYVNKGDPLVEIVGTQQLEIEMVLPSIGIADYRKGKQFSITIDETGDTFPAVVDRVVGVIDPVSQTVRVIGKLTDRSHNLLPGMSGVISFDGV